MGSHVTVFGLGAMGVALASKFLESGYEVTVWNRSPEKASLLTEKGAHLASTARDAFQASRLAVICLLDNKAVHETLRQAPSALSGLIIVNLTNGTPEHARTTASLVTGLGAKYIHGGIMAVPAMIGSPAAVILYSGSREGFQQIERDLGVLGADKFLGTDVGLASLHDLALLSGMYGLFSGFIHAVSLVHPTHTTATGFLPLLIPWLTAMTGYLNVLAKQIDDDNFATQGSSISMQLPGLSNIVQASEAQGVSADLIRPLQSLMKHAVEMGKGNDDISTLVGLTANVGKKI